MTPLLRTAALATAILLGALGARAEDQQTLTAAALQALATSAQALERGDSAQAAAVLADMTATVGTLRATAERYRTAARSAETVCQKRGVAIVGEIENVFQQQRALEREAGELDAQVAGQQAQYDRAVENLQQVSGAMRALADEMQVRHSCNANIKYYFDNFSRCFGMVAETVFTARDRELRQSFGGMSRNRDTVLQAMREAQARRARLAQDIEARRSQARALEGDRRHLEQQDRAVRAAATLLSDITAFWARTQTLIDSRIVNPLGLLRDLLPALDRTSNTPVFDDYDRQEVRTLRATLLDFARTLDNRTNFLLAPTICR